MDVSQNGGQKLETVLPNIRRFLLDYNVPWPTLVNGSGDRDYAKAYGVADIPANVLIGRDGPSFRSTCRAGTSNRCLPECSVLEPIVEFQKTITGSQYSVPPARRGLAGLSKRVVQAEQEEVKRVRNSRRGVTSNFGQCGFAVLEQLIPRIGHGRDGGRSEFLDQIGDDQGCLIRRVALPFQLASDRSIVRPDKRSLGVEEAADRDHGPGNRRNFRLRRIVTSLSGIRRRLRLASIPGDRRESTL